MRSQVGLEPGLAQGLQADISLQRAIVRLRAARRVLQTFEIGAMSELGSLSAGCPQWAESRHRLPWPEQWARRRVNH
jgi:hypothetical protein